MRKPLLFVLPLLALLAPTAASAAETVKGTFAVDGEATTVATGAVFSGTLKVTTRINSLKCLSGFEVSSAGASICNTKLEPDTYDVSLRATAENATPTAPLEGVTGDEVKVTDPTISPGSIDSVTTGQREDITFSVTNPGRVDLPALTVTLGYQGATKQASTGVIRATKSASAKFTIVAPAEASTNKTSLNATLSDEFGGGTASAGLEVIAPDVTLTPTVASVARGGSFGLEISVANDSATPWSDAVVVKLGLPKNWGSGAGTSISFAPVPVGDPSPKSTTLFLPDNATLGTARITGTAGGVEQEATVKVEAVVPPATPTPMPTPTVEPTPTPTPQPTPTPAPVPTPTAVLLAEPAPTPAPVAHLKTLIYKRGGKLFQRYKAELVLGTKSVSHEVCKTAHLTLTAEGQYGSKWKRLATAKVDALIAWEKKQKRCVIDTGFRFGTAMKGKPARFKFSGSFKSAGALYKLDETALTSPRKGRPAKPQLVVS